MIVRKADRYLVEGPMTFATAAALLAEGDAMEGSDIIVDLAGVTAADSSALSLLMEWTRRSRNGGRRIAYANLGPNLRNLAGMYGVIDLLPCAS
ncbi:MAG TPA: STAS domain-containing protein [Burkholderiales bacterium]|nr:STAS domain-containing protein [Burkholderiales bacterium]